MRRELPWREAVLVAALALLLGMSGSAALRRGSKGRIAAAEQRRSAAFPYSFPRNSRTNSVAGPLSYMLLSSTTLRATSPWKKRS